MRLILKAIIIKIIIFNLENYYFGEIVQENSLLE